jgi:hypothetical protein
MTIDTFRATVARLIIDALLTYKLPPADLLSVLEDEAALLQEEIENHAGGKR